MNEHDLSHKVSSLGAIDYATIAFVLVYVILLIIDFFRQKNDKELILSKIRKTIPLPVILIILFVFFEEFAKHYFSDTKAVTVLFVLSFILTIIHEYVIHLLKTKNELKEKLENLDKKLDPKLSALDEKLNNFENENEKLKKLNTQFEKHLGNAETKLQTHPIVATKDDFRETINNLFKLNGVRAVAVDFALNSLKDISNKAFIKIDVSFIEYTEKLLELLESSKSVIGTFTIRPNKINDLIKSGTTKSQSFEKYISKFKTLENATRCVVFELDEINEILKNAIDKMENGGKEKTIPEIDLLMNDFSSSNTKLLWSITPVFLKYLKLDSINNEIKNIIVPDDYNYMTDFAIIDQELLIVWRENHSKLNKNELKGTLFMNWSNSIKLISDKIIKYNNTNDLIVRDFYDLLKRINNKNNISYVYPNSLKDFKTLYNQLIDNLNNNMGWD